VSTEPKKNELQSSPTDGAGVVSVRQFLVANRPKIEATLRGIPYERFANVVLNSMRRVPDLANCSASSLIHCIGICAELGLEPGGPLGHAYLIPFGQKCELIIGYRGYLHLMYRNGSLKDAEAHVVYENEVASGSFKLVRGVVNQLHHEVKFGTKKGKPVGAYCILRFANGGVHIEPMDWEEIQGIKARSKAGKSGPWVTDENEMAKKTTLRRGQKWSPTGQDDDMSKAMENDYDVVDSAVVPPAAAPALPSETNLQVPVVDATEKAKQAVANAQGDLTSALKASVDSQKPSAAT
jgi:recombination protein RecT